MYSTIEIAQFRATAESKLALRAYSVFLKELYASFAECSNVGKLLLIRFLLSKWDSRQGAVNAFTESQLSNQIRTLNKL